MARRRMIDPAFWYDTKLVTQLDQPGRLMFIALWTLAEDSGCFQADPLAIQLQAYPANDLSVESIEQYLRALVEMDSVVKYEHGGDEYGWIVNFRKYQHLDRPSPPKLPLPAWITWHGEDEFGKDRHKYYFEVADMSRPEEKRTEDKLVEATVNPIEAEMEDRSAIHSGRDAFPSCLDVEKILSAVMSAWGKLAPNQKQDFASRIRSTCVEGCNRSSDQAEWCNLSVVSHICQGPEGGWSGNYERDKATICELLAGRDVN